MEIKTFTLGMYQSNNYLVYENGHALLIDLGAGAEAVFNFLQENNLILDQILLTHGHLDHVDGVDELLTMTGPVPVYLHEEDAIAILEKKRIFGHMAAKTTAIENGSKIAFGEKTIEVFTTPGHTKGGVSFLVENRLFTGDTLFKHNVGRTDLYGGSEEEIIASVTEKLYTLPDDTIVYPGHDAATTIGHEKKYNMYVKDYLKNHEK